MRVCHKLGKHFQQPFHRCLTSHFHDISCRYICTEVEFSHSGIVEYSSSSHLGSASELCEMNKKCKLMVPSVYSKATKDSASVDFKHKWNYFVCSSTLEGVSSMNDAFILTFIWTVLLSVLFDLGLWILSTIWLESYLLTQYCFWITVEEKPNTWKFKMRLLLTMNHLPRFYITNDFTVEISQIHILKIDWIERWQKMCLYDMTDCAVCLLVKWALEWLEYWRFLMKISSISIIVIQ